MPCRNGPHTRPPGFDAERTHLPRAIAARLMRAGRITELPAATAPSDAANEPHGADGGGRDESRQSPSR